MWYLIRIDICERSELLQHTDIIRCFSSCLGWHEVCNIKDRRWKHYSPPKGTARVQQERVRAESLKENEKCHQEKFVRSAGFGSCYWIFIKQGLDTDTQRNARYAEICIMKIKVNAGKSLRLSNGRTLQEKRMPNVRFVGILDVAQPWIITIVIQKKRVSPFRNGYARTLLIIKIKEFS